MPARILDSDLDSILTTVTQIFFLVYMPCMVGMNLLPRPRLTAKPLRANVTPYTSIAYRSSLRWAYTA
jgi:hypothetical protein